jgi:hypothetical protein
VSTNEPGNAQGNEPGERRDPDRGRAGRRLEVPPSARYRREGGLAGEGRGSPVQPLAKAGIAGAVGAAALFVVGAILASHAGLVLVAGATGASVGLILARAAITEDERAPALTRRAVAWLSIGIVVLAVVVAALATWLFARQEGGVLGLVDYLVETFGPLVPAELVVGALTAAWGARAGPVQRS